MEEKSKGNQTPAEGAKLIDAAYYLDGKRQTPAPLSIPEAAKRSQSSEGFIWIGLHFASPQIGESDRDALAEAGRELGLHELAREDALKAHQRPKIEEYPEHVFMVLRTIDKEADEVKSGLGEIHLFIGPSFVLSVRHGPAAGLRDARRRLEARPDLLKLGPMAAAWAIIDSVVDSYEPVAADIERRSDQLQEEVFEKNTAASTRAIQLLRREIVELDRLADPLLFALEHANRNQLETEYGQGFFPIELNGYFRDVIDHLKRVQEQNESAREILSEIREANLALASMVQNDVMKRISGWAAIIAVPTFIASIYGMNFKHMPELESAIGYPIVLITMIGSVIGLYIWFKRANWI